MAESSHPKSGRPLVSVETVTPTAHHNLADPPPPSSTEGEGEDGSGSASAQEPTRLSSPRRGRRYVPAGHERRAGFTAQQRLLILDAWQRSSLPARDFAPLVGLSRHTLYAWKQRFEQMGPGVLIDQPRGAPTGSKLPELTKRTILLLKQAHPDWGCQKISDMLLRGPALSASPGAVGRVMDESREPQPLAEQG